MADTINIMSEKLENLDKTRSDFVANASHELKTPLSSIKILTESLLYQNHVSEETYQEFLSDINQQIDRMTGLLDDLLVLSQTDHADAAAQKRPIALGELIADTFSTLEPLAMENNVALIAPETGIVLNGDSALLRMALVNLVNNAIKYNREGGSVTILTTQTNTMTTIRIVDTGIGIPAQDLPHLFERFYRVDKARSRETGGTGLGLSIVDSIVRLHGGAVTVESEPGKGSTFTITLPNEEAIE